MKRLFLDTNILVDLVCNREPFVTDAKNLFAMAYLGKVNIGISALSYINTVYIARKYHLDTQSIIESLKKIASFTTITQLNETTIKQAMDCGWNDFEDAVQYHSSLPYAADYIITRNPKDFKNSTIPVYSPTEFLQIPFWVDESNPTVLNEPETEYGRND
ncbi:MAG: PIN domain-containing protein [Bacteroides sp.]|nr:PIN domain-containing protein [Bacteroides sp.]